MSNRTGRNEPCPCGSGKKFKRCHAQIPGTASQKVEFGELRHEARIVQRQQQQGFGNPIVSAELKGHRLVRVGNKFYSSRWWTTFHDFLLDYGRMVFGAEWWLGEMHKHSAERHPVVSWFDLAQPRLIDGSQLVRARPMTGAAAAYLDIAYDLFSLQHNTEVRTRLLGRLKDPGNFPGAHYEVHVAAAFIRAGFQIAFEDEDDWKTSHCEFVATSKRTGRSFSVEAKHRVWPKGQDPTSRRLRIGHKVNAALGKNAKHPRVVFIDVNVPDESAEVNGSPGYMKRALKDVRRFERTALGQSLPPAYLFITNRPFHHHLDSTRFRLSFAIEGFGIPEFKGDAPFLTIFAAAEARERHAEMHQLAASIKEHAEVPATFDGQSPELAFGEHEPQLLTGERYLVPDANGLALPATLETAVVAEHERRAYASFAFDDGSRIISMIPLSDAELEAYRRHPDTFFGVIQQAPRQISHPLEVYDFILGSYRNAPRERLLTFLATAPDIEQLKELSQPELAKIYAERCAYGTLALVAQTVQEEQKIENPTASSGPSPSAA